MTNEGGAGVARYVASDIVVPVFAAVAAAIVSAIIVSSFVVDQTAEQVARLERQAAVANITGIRSGLVDALVVLRPSSSATPEYKAAIAKLTEANSALSASDVEGGPVDLRAQALGIAQSAYREVQSNVRGLCEGQLAAANADPELVRACLVVVTQPPVTLADLLNAKALPGEDRLDGASPSPS